MTIQEFYKVNPEYNATTASVKNGFMECLQNEVRNNLNNLKISALDLGTILSKQCLGQYNCVENLLKREPFLGVTKYKNIEDELVAYRANLWGLSLEEISLTGRRTLIADYFLNSCICYVEYIRGTTPTKFYATRNVALLDYLSKLNESDPYAFVLNKPLADCKGVKEACRPMTTAEVTAGTLKFIKIDGKKKGTFAVSVPRSSINLEVDNIRIVPLFFNYELRNNLLSLLSKGVYSVSYLKDNMIERNLITSINHDIITKVYNGNSNYASEVLLRTSTEFFHKGYITVPELLLPVYDDTGCRALNLRIVKIEKLDENTFTNPYWNADLDGVPNAFRSYIERAKVDDNMARNLAYLLKLQFSEIASATGDDKTKKINELVAKLGSMSGFDVQMDLYAWLDMQLAFDKTQTVRALYTFMRQNPMFFPAYTGTYVASAPPVVADWSLNG